MSSSKFWEESFIKHKRMWGNQPAKSATKFAQSIPYPKQKKILIFGIGYGRNASPFLDLAMKVEGIEHSPHAIHLGKSQFGDKVKFIRGGISTLGQIINRYDYIYCYCVYHLLTSEERKLFFHAAHHALEDDGKLVLLTLSTSDNRFNKGKNIDAQTYVTKHGIELHFSTTESLASEAKEFSKITIEDHLESNNLHLDKSQNLLELTAEK